MVGDLTVVGHANAATSSVEARDTAHVFTGIRAVSLANTTTCSDSTVTQTSNLEPIGGFPASLVVDHVTVPTDREGTIAHGGAPVPFHVGQGVVTAFDGQSLWGTWVVTQALRTDEHCGPDSTHGAAGLVVGVAAASVRCPSTPPGMTPGIITDQCGHLGQDCCPTVAQCGGGLMCLNGHCVMGATTCIGAPVTPGVTREWPFEVIDATTRCAVGTPVSVVADNEGDARGCLTAMGIVAEPSGDVHPHRWHNPDTTCLLGSGSFHSLDADQEQCARSLCGCDAPEIDGRTCP